MDRRSWCTSVDSVDYHWLELPQPAGKQAAILLPRRPDQGRERGKLVVERHGHREQKRPERDQDSVLHILQGSDGKSVLQRLQHIESEQQGKDDEEQHPHARYPPEPAVEDDAKPQRYAE